MAINHLDGDSPSPSLPEFDPLTVHLSRMRRQHLRSVMQIETNSYSHPWNMSLFVSELALRSKRSYTVARVGSLVVGFAGLMFITDEAHVTNIAVDPIWRGHSIATRLMLHKVRVALQNGCRNMTLEVRLSNVEAQGLYRKFGFAPAGIRKNYYAEDGEDALVMWANDIDSDQYAMRMSAIEAAVPGVTISEVPS